MVGIIASSEKVVGDVEVTRSGIIREDADVYVFKPAVLNRQPLGPGDKLRSGPDADLCIPDRDSLEVVVIGGFDVEEVKVAIAVKDHVTIARRFDGDRLFRSAARRQVIGSLEGRGGIDGVI